MGDISLSDLIDPAAEARLRAAVAGTTAPPPVADPVEAKADEEFVDASTGALEVKDGAAPVTMEHKSAPAVAGGTQVLEADNQTGRVTALVSITGVEDRVKDIIEPGAYTKTLAEREPIGVWSHDDKTWVARTESAVELMPGDPFFADIKTMDGKPWPKEAGAVKVEALFNLETPHGKAAFSDVKFFQGKTGWSIGYRATQAARSLRTGVRRIKALDWYEYSPVMVGAASQPMTLSVKSLAQPVDELDDTGLVDEAVFDELTEAEVKAYFDLRESMGLEVKDRVRTAAGMERYKQPMGSVIVPDGVGSDVSDADLESMISSAKAKGDAAEVAQLEEARGIDPDKRRAALESGKLAAHLDLADPSTVGPGDANDPQAAEAITDSQLQKLFGEATTPEQKDKIRAALKLPAGERRAFLAGDAKPASPPAPKKPLDSTRRTSDTPAPEDAREKDQRRQRATDDDRAADNEANAKTKAREALAAENRKRRAAGKPPLLKLPEKKPAAEKPKETIVKPKLTMRDDGVPDPAAKDRQAINDDFRDGHAADKPKSPQQAKVDALIADLSDWSDAEVADFRKRQADLAKHYTDNGQPAMAARIKRMLAALDGELERRNKKADPDPLEEKGSSASLDRSPRSNWVEKAGDLPPYVREVARGVEKDGHPLDQAIPIAISRIKRWAAGLDGASAETQAKAKKAVAEWEALKAKSHLKYDSDLLAHLERKTCAHLDAIDAAWELLETSGEIKAFLGIDDTEEEVPQAVDEPVESKTLPTDPEVVDVSDLVARAAELKAAVTT